jgi:hypothetical protein
MTRSTRKGSWPPREVGSQLQAVPPQQLSVQLFESSQYYLSLHPSWQKAAREPLRRGSRPR